MAVTDPNTHVVVTFKGAAAGPDAVWRLISDFRASMVVWRCDVLVVGKTAAGQTLRTMTFGSFPPVSEVEVVCDPGTGTMQYDGWDADTGAPTEYQSQMTVGAAGGDTTIDWLAHSIGATGAADNVTFYTNAAHNIAGYLGAEVSVEVLKP